jgi:hypothetical protein
MCNLLTTPKLLGVRLWDGRAHVRTGPGGAGARSTHARCTTRQDTAAKKMIAARMARRFPPICEMLLAGSLSLTTLRLLAPHLKNFNHERLLASAAGKSKREVQELLARMFPQPDVATSVRKAPMTRSPVEVVFPLVLAGLPPSSASPVASPGAAGAPDEVILVPVTPPIAGRPPSFPPPAASSYKPLVTPLAADRYRITFTASGETREKLEFARDLLRHAIPNGDPAEIIDRALTALLHEIARKKLAETDKPRTGRGKRKPSHYIPAGVKRVVWVRDRGRCAFIGADGHRCGERGFVEFHYNDVPYGAGGKPTVDNIQLRCRAHNQHEADVYYGLGRGDDRVQETEPAYGSLTGRTTGSGPSCVPGTQALHGRLQGGMSPRELGR